MAFDISKMILAVHVAVGLIIIGTGLQYLLAGQPAGLAVQGLLGLLIIGAGVTASRAIDKR
jgi:hypothetical protein